MKHVFSDMLNKFVVEVQTNEILISI